MSRTPSPWQVVLARLECAMPFLPDPVTGVLALRGLRRAWQAHMREFHTSRTGHRGIETIELMRSPLDAERQHFLSWINLRAHAPLAKAAARAMIAGRLKPQMAPSYSEADRALTLLDSLPAAPHPVETLATFVARLQESAEPDSANPAWAAALAIAVRPELFALKGAPLALAGVIPGAVFRAGHGPAAGTAVADMLGEAIRIAVGNLRDDFVIARHDIALAEQCLGTRATASHALDAWRLLVGLGPMTHIELGRGLGMQKDATVQTVRLLVDAGLISPGEDGAFVVVKSSI